MSQPVAVRVVLSGDRPPWTPTGLEVRRGERVTLLGSGRIRWAAGHSGGAKYHLWGRVPGGEIFGCTQDTTTVVADRTGPLELCVHLGAWADRAGTLVDDTVAGSPYGRDRGALTVTVLRWPAGLDPVDGLAALAPGVADPALVAAERQRLLDPVVPPAGWTYHLAGGPADVYRHAAADGRPAIEVLCDDDSGIVERPVDVPLRPGTAIEWSWRVEELPGRVAENTRWTHDLLGIAAAFDDGPSLSWFWSACLTPDDDAFDCPHRTHPAVHIPVRRGPAGIGRWRHETREVLADHERYLGPPPPRITAVRLLAVSHFRHGRARATFRDIALRTGNERVQVL
jgi:hypothetical protein